MLRAEGLLCDPCPEGQRAKRFIAVGIAVRVLYGIVLHPPLHYVTSDMAGYVDRAQRLSSGARLTRLDYFMPSGTQLLISLPMRFLGSGRAGLWGASVLWCVMSCLFPVLAWKWSQRVLSARTAAFVAAGCSLSPLAVIYGGYFSSELPATVLLPAALFLIERAVEQRRVPVAIAAGGAAVLLLLVRQQFALNIIVAGLFALGIAGWRAVLRLAAWMTVGAAIVLPVAYVLVAPPGRIAVAPTALLGRNGGLNFFYGHCDGRFVVTKDLHFENPVRAQRGTGSDFTIPDRNAGDQGYFLRRGFDCIGRSPLRAAVLELRSVGDMTLTSIPFPPWTEGGVVLVLAEVTNVLFCLAVVIALLASARLKGDNRRRVEPIVHLACGFMVALIFLGEPRYRLAYDIFGWAILGYWVEQRSRGRTYSAVQPRLAADRGPKVIESADEE